MTKGFRVLEEAQKSIQGKIGDVYCPGRFCLRQSCVYVQTWKELDQGSYDYLQCKACCRFQNTLFNVEKPKNWFFGGDGA